MLLNEAGRGSHPDLSTLNGARLGMDLRVQGPPGVGSGWSGVSGLVQRPLITSSAGGGGAVMPSNVVRRIDMSLFLSTKWNTFHESPL